MHCFYIKENQICQDQIEIVGDDINHIKNVLRMLRGEEILLCDGNGKFYRCCIEAFTGHGIQTKILEVKEAETELSGKIYLFQGLPKKDKMELIIQKAVELGVYEIVPVSTKFCVAKMEDAKKEKKKLERWQAISMAAAKQSKRGRIPTVCSIVTFKEAVERIKEMDAGLMPYECAEGMEYAKNEISKASSEKSIGVLIGPEGGFSQEEVRLAKEEGLKVISLGKRILRTETAGLVILSLLMFQMETDRS